MDLQRTRGKNSGMLAQFMRVPQGAWSVVKEAARHLLRRPVVGIAAAARTEDGRWLLVRRTDTGEWALPGGTLEWGETLRTAIVRELREEAGVDEVTLGELSGVYSLPARDARFHAVTIVVKATVSEPSREPENPVEIAEVGLFTDDALPSPLAYTMSDMLNDARADRVVLE
jgi:8-oxo-dGTP diphosphatase